MITPWQSAVHLAASVASGEVRATDVAAAALERIEARNEELNAFTDLTAERALREADRVDRARVAGEHLGALAGVPYAVKNLFDLEGVVTRAGSKILRERPPATADAHLVRRLARAGAVCVGALNMDEFAYGFTTENAHDGNCRNPHDSHRSAGGSSGGSGAAVAAGLVPLALGTDTNGSIRVPASLCGVFGLKPTYGRLGRSGAFPFVDSLDHVGPFARSVAELATIYDVLQGIDSDDPGQAPVRHQAVVPVLQNGVDGLRMAVLKGHFAHNGHEDAFSAVESVARALDISEHVILDDADVARAAAFLITASEGADLHRDDLRRRPFDFDPATRDRLLAGSLVPGQWVLRAQRFRDRFRKQAQELFANVDVLLAPATPYTAPLLGQATIEVDGTMLPVRPMLGVFTQPISFIGLPVLTVPLMTARSLPIGVQLIAAPWREAALFVVAARLEQMGIVHAPRPAAFA